MKNFFTSKLKALALIVLTSASLNLSADDDCCPRSECDPCCGSSSWWDQMRSQISQIDWCTGWTAQLRAAAFWPQEQRFRRIYDKWGATYQYEIGKDLFCGIGAWANVGWFSKRGHAFHRRERDRDEDSGFDSLSFGDSDHFRRDRNRTRIQIVPVSFGLKYTYCLCDCAHVYAGIGPCITSLRVRDHSCFVHKRTDRVGVGGTAKFGIQYDWDCNLFFDLFGDHSYQPFCFRNRRNRDDDSSSNFSSLSSSGSEDRRYVRRRNTNTGGLMLGLGVGYRF